jgi:hypothetical protein
VARCLLTVCPSPRCDAFERELAELRLRLGSAGPDGAFAPAPELVVDGEAEGKRWLAAHPRAAPADAFRAGWSAMARFVAPRLREWEARWWGAVRQNEQLRSQIGVLIREISRLSDRG